MDYRLIQGDCLEVLPTLAGPVDMILADLPYGTTACAWDSVIPFEPLWAQYKRLIKPRGAVVLFGSQPFTSALVMSNPGWFKYEWVWDKKLATGFLDANRKPMKRHENIVVFSDSAIIYNPQFEKGTPYKRPPKADFAGYGNLNYWQAVTKRETDTRHQSLKSATPTGTKTDTQPKSPSPCSNT